MDPDKLMYYIKTPDRLDEIGFRELSVLVREYPYFQAARLLYIRCLKEIKDPSYANQLNITAAYIPDRRKLFVLLNREPEFKNTEQEERKIHPTRVERQKKRSIRGTRDIKIKPLRVPPSFVPVEEHENTSEKTLEPDRNAPFQKDKEELKQKELLEFDYMASRDESDVFELEDESGVVELVPESNYDLIEQFISKGHKIVAKENDKKISKDVSLSSLSESDDLITETLANVYISQGYYIKAINSYEKLSLKFPEKSTYFAARIKEVENLIKNQ